MRSASTNSFTRTFLAAAALLFFICGKPASGQDMEVGLFGGGAYYLGDLNPGKHFMNTQLAYGVLGRYNVDPRWAVKLGVSRGTVKGDASQSTFLPDRQLNFSSYILDISAMAEFNFFPYFTGSKRNWVTPYIFGGFSLFFFNPVANGYELKNFGTEGQNIGYNGRKPYSTVGYGLPFGLGVKISLAKKLGLQVYWEMHKTFSDYIDDVSTTYYLNGKAIDPGSPEQILSDPSMNHQPDMQRGNSRTKDWYAFFGVSLTYKFKIGSNKRCRDLEN